MVAELNVDANVIEVRNFLKKLSQKQKKTIQKSLNRVSNMAILMITKRTQSGKLPDGGNFIPYTQKTKEIRNKGNNKVTVSELDVT